MVIESATEFDAEAKPAADPEVVAWKQLMGSVQRPPPRAAADARWTAARRIFALAGQH